MFHLIRQFTPNSLNETFVRPISMHQNGTFHSFNTTIKYTMNTHTQKNLQLHEIFIDHKSRTF